MRLNHLRTIAKYWDAEAERYCTSHPEHLVAELHPSWGLWHVREEALGILSRDLRPGSRLVELGCGRGHDAVGFARLGAEVLAIDISENFLNNSLPHQGVTYLCCSAESVPVVSGSVDIVVSDHGAFDHSPPNLLLPEIHRMLKAGGALVVCTYSPLALCCYDEPSGRLQRQLTTDYPSYNALFDGTLTTNSLSYSSWVQAFGGAGFQVERLEELIAPKDAPAYFSDLVDHAWAERWPCDIVWLARKL